MTTFYLSGPMRGYPQTNFPAFDEAKRYIESCSDEDDTPWVALSPADNDRRVWPGIEQVDGFQDGLHLEADPPEGFSFPELFVWDVQAIGQADCIVLLPGWEDSEGANLELQVALAFKKYVMFAVFEDGKCVYVQAFDPNVSYAEGVSL